MLCWPRYLVWFALAVQCSAQSACSAEPGSHPSFLDGECASGQRNYRGFCLQGGSDLGTTSSGVTGQAGNAGRDMSSSAARDGGGSNTEPADASSSVSQDAGMSVPPGADAGMQSPAACEPRAETCNGGDDDCDGRSDEQVAVACYAGETGCAPNDAAGYQCSGLCGAGVQRCSGGELGACEGQLLPASAEACTSADDFAADEDCDGRVDEGCSCSGQTQACYSGEARTRNVPPCRPGMQTCGPEGFGECEDEVLPASETCANPGVDDDCDGATDDVAMVGVPCSEAANMGLCASGVFRCSGAALVCATPSPIAETCDRRDEDCDGDSDEDFDLQTDVRHCGTCGHACSGGQDCCGGSCVTLATSNSHCGGCGMPCANGQACCDGGCRDVQNDEANCGACGTVCGAGLTCCGGSCVDTIVNADHCGSCGNDCGGSMNCCDGACFDLSMAQDHCGSCGNGCAAVLEGCCRGSCKLLSLGC